MPVVAIALQAVFEAASAAAATVAGAVGTAIGGGAMGMAAAQGVGTFVASLGFANGIGAGLSAWSATLMAGSMLSSLAFHAPQPATGGQVNIGLDPQAPVPILWGRSGVAGNVVYRNAWDSNGSKDNFYLGVILALTAGGVTGGFEYMTADDFGLNFNMNPEDGVGQVVSTNPATTGLYKNNNFQVRYGRGHLNPAKVQEWSQHVQPTEWPGLDNNSKLSGITFATIVAGYKKDQFPNGWPKPLITAKGQLCYDPRKDSTFTSAAGNGSGPHRIDDPNTWEWTQNNFLMCLKYLVGYQENNQPVFGVFVPPSRIDWASFVYGANIADANNWTCGGLTTTADSKFATVTALLQAGGAVPVNRGGKISCLISTPGTSIYTLDSSQVTGPIQTVSTLAWQDRVNRVFPSYREESQWWQFIQAPLVSSQNYIDEDGGQWKTKSVNYTLVQNATQVRQLAGLDLTNSREWLNVTVNVRLGGLNVQAGDCCTLNVPEIGADSMKMRCVSRRYNPSAGTVELVLRTETDAKYAWAMNQVGNAPDAATLNGYDPTNPAAPGLSAWSITATSVTTATGYSQPALVVEGAVDSPVVADVFVYFRELGGTDADWKLGAAGSRYDTHFTIQNVAPGIEYEVGVAYLSILGVNSEKTAYGPAIAGASVAGGLTPNAVQWGDGSIGSIPVGLSTDANGLLYANNVSYNGVTVADEFSALGRQYQGLVQEVANVSAANDLTTLENEISNVAINSMQSAVREYNLRADLNSTTYINGVAVGAVVSNTITEMAANDSLFASKFDLIGEVTPDGQAMVLSNTTLLWDATGKTVVTKVNEIETLTANNAASLFDQVNAISDDLGSLTLSFHDYEATSNANVANVVSFSQAMANKANATAQITTALGAFNPASSTLILDGSKVYANATTTFGQFLTSTTSQLGTNTAQIATVNNTLATANSALSTRIDTVSSTVGNHTASINTLTSSVNGIQASWGVAVESGNYVSGIRLINTGTTSGLVLDVNQLTVVQPGVAAKVPLQITGDGVTHMSSVVVDTLAAGTIYGAHINPGVIDTTKLGGQAVSVANYANDGGVAILGTSASTLSSTGVTCDDASESLLIIFSADITNVSSSQRPTAWLQLYVDGNQVKNTVNYINVAQTQTCTHAAVAITPGAGFHSISLVGWINQNLQSQVYKSYNEFTIMRFKR